jgi:lipid-A-disaccharide synthase
VDEPAGELSAPGQTGEGGRGRVVFLSVGEPSGDLHGAALARALRSRIPNVRLIGLGGPQMAAAGVELLADLEDLAVMGFVEVISRLPYFLRLRKQVFAALARERVDLVVPVDYPGFNLRLARRARTSGIPVLYYIAPQVWAWHVSRARDLARDADRIAVILPFEEGFLRAWGAAAEFVGHPLLDRAVGGETRNEWCERLGLESGRPLLGLFPGSRRQEVERHLEVFSQAATLLEGRVPGIQVLVGAASGIPDAAYAGSRYRLTREAADLLRHSTGAIVKSGTTTLEAALAGTPIVVAYRMNPLSYRIARRVVRVPHVALANLVAGRRLVPELVQEEVTPARLADELLPLLDAGGARREEMIRGFAEVRSALGGGGAATRVAEIAAELMSLRPKPA